VQECGADVGAPDNDGTTPVAIAAQNFHMAWWALVQECGAVHADAGAANKNGTCG